MMLLLLSLQPRGIDIGQQVRKRGDHAENLRALYEVSMYFLGFGLG
jgi:hypothetical protein